MLTNTQFAPPYFGYQHITAALAARDGYFYSVNLYAYVGRKI